MSLSLLFSAALPGFKPEEGRQRIIASLTSLSRVMGPTQCDEVDHLRELLRGAVNLVEASVLSSLTSFKVS